MTRSGLRPASTVPNMSRSENASPISTPDRSRRPSLLNSGDGDAERVEKHFELEGVGDGDVGTKGCSLRSTESKIRQQIMDLDSFSMEAARSLNDTCDAMQEKMASLQEIVIALKQLADSSRDIHDSFDQVSHDLERDITRQLDAMGHFEGQRDTIQSLQRRIRRGRQRIEALSARVEVVRRRVEGWEEADRAWQERTRKRLTVVWMALTVLAAVVIGILMIADYSRGGGEATTTSAATGDGDGERHGVGVNSSTGTWHLDAVGGVLTAGEGDAGTGSGEEREKAGTDNGLWARAFDEL